MHRRPPTRWNLTANPAANPRKREMQSWHAVAIHQPEVVLAIEQDQILECVGVRERVRLDLEEHLRQAVNDVGRAGAARVGHADRHVAILGHGHCHGRAGGLDAGHRHARVRRRRHGQNQRVGAVAADAVVKRQRIEGGVQVPRGGGLGVVGLRRQTRQQGPRDHIGRHLADRLAGPVLVLVRRRHPQKRVRVRRHRRVARRSGAVDHGPGVAARGPLPLPEGRSGGHAVRVGEDGPQHDAQRGTGRRQRQRAFLVHVGDGDLDIYLVGEYRTTVSGPRHQLQLIAIVCSATRRPDIQRVLEIRRLQEPERARWAVQAEEPAIYPARQPLDAGPVLLRGRSEGRHPRPTVLREGDAVRPGDRRELSDVQERHEQLGHVRISPVAHLHGHFVGAVRVGVVRGLVVLGRDEGEDALTGEAELAGIGAARVRPDQIGCCGVAVVCSERGDRGLAFIDQEGALTGDVGRGHGLRDRLCAGGEHKHERQQERAAAHHGGKYPARKCSQASPDQGVLRNIRVTWMLSEAPLPSTTFATTA